MSESIILGMQAGNHDKMTVLKSVTWYDPDRVRQDKALQETRMPASLEDAKTGMEHLKFMLAAEDVSLFTPKQESRASSTTEPATPSQNSM